MQGVLLGVLGVILALSKAVADELILRDGSRLKGEAVTKKDGTLEFKTSFAGTIKVKWDEVEELRTDKTARVLTQDKEIIPARVFRNTDNMTMIETELEAPPLEMGKEQVAYINPEPWRTGEGVKFTGNANVAIESERGNSESDEIDMDAQATVRREHDRFRSWFTWEKESNNGSRTKNKWKLRGNYNYFFAEKWYYGATAAFERDQFADLRLRSTVGPVIGHQFFESEALNLSVEAGPNYVWENFKVAEDQDYPAAGWQIHYDQFFFNKFVQLYHDQSGLWNLDDTGDVVWDTWTGVRVPLFAGIIGSGEIQVEYDSGAPDNVDSKDTTYRLKLGYAW